jgi:hypothetical protein
VEDLLAFDIALRKNKLLTEEMRDRLFTPDPERNSPSYVDSGYTFVALCNGSGARLAYMKTLALIERR